MQCSFSFAENCQLKDIQCKVCKCFDPDQPLLYKPIAKQDALAYKKHPVYIEEQQLQKHKLAEAKRERQASASFKNAQNNNRQGRRIEEQVLKKLKATSTVASGAVYGDADGYILIAGHRYYIEHKARLNNKNTLGPRLPEWQKAREQGASIFMVTSQEQGTLVTMSQATFNELIELANKASAIEDLIS